MGKGLSTWVILELLIYISASLIPLALPLAILLSSIMTMGNLAENNELTALKASGLSLYRIMRPLTYVVLCIALFTFYFANYVIPVANLKWHSLIYDIQNTKIATIITPGVYSKELDGYAIKIDEGTQEGFKGIIIHDHTSPTTMKTIRAKSGKIFKSQNGKYLFFELEQGNVSEELAPQAPSFLPNGELHSNSSSNRPARQSSFEKATYKVALSGFSFSKSEEDMFQDKHEMLNVFQITSAVDSIRRDTKRIQDNFLKSMKNDHTFFADVEINKSTTANTDYLNKNSKLLPKEIRFSELSKLDKIKAIQFAQTKIRRKNQNLTGQIEYLKGTQRDLNGYWTEFHRKFSLTYAIIVLFFVGAPLGAIVRKGGFGAPVVIAALLFMVYFVMISIGDNLAEAGVASPFLCMWFPSMVLTPVALVLMRAAANDSKVFDKDTYLKLFRSKKTKKLAK